MNTKSMIRTFCLTLILALSSFNNHTIACRINGAFKALEIYDYFKAKKKFEKLNKKNRALKAYGLSVIQFRNDNPFHDLNSAYHNALVAVELYEKLPKSTLKKLEKKQNITIKDFLAQRERISNHYFELAKEENSIPGYIKFMAKHPWSHKIDSAFILRRNLAYEIVLNKNTSIAYGKFLEQYPESPFDSIVQNKLYLTQFQEITNNETLAAYEEFLNKFPKNPYSVIAEDKIFEMTTSKKDIQSYDAFVKNYPNNRNANQAWKNLYRLYTAGYKDETFNSFKKKYPNFPFPEMLANDLDLLNKKLFPYKFQNTFGFIDEKGLPIIPHKYEYAGLFSNGLAAVMQDNKIGFINKSNELVIGFRFDDVQDFHKGRSIVEENGYFGMIDITGNYVLLPEFDDIGSIEHNMFYAEKNGSYNFYNPFGKQVFKIDFEEAYTFENGMAKVISNGSQKYIDTLGNDIIAVKHGEIFHYHDSLFVWSNRDSSILVDHNLNRISELSFVKIGTISNNRALVTDDEKFGFIDEKGTLVIPLTYNKYPNYYQFSQFVNNHAIINKNGKFGLIDSLGNQIFPAIFEAIGNFGTFTPVSKGKGWGYADEKTKLTIPYQFDYAYPFVNGLAIVQKEGLYGLIDLQNKFIIEPMYEAIQQLSKELFILKSDNLFQLFISKENKIIDFTFLRYDFIEDDVLQLEGPEEIAYYFITKGALVTLLKEHE